jgi:hypothetical protein
VGTRQRGLSETTVRVPLGHENIPGILWRAFTKLFKKYGAHGKGFDVVVTANAVLHGNEEGGRYRMFFGQDYGEVRELTFAAPMTVRHMSQVTGLRTDYDQEDFERVFFRNFEDSDVTVEEGVSVVYIICRLMRDYMAERTTLQPQFNRLF